VNPACKTIVLVDDEKAYADFLATMLHELLQVPVCTFSRAQEALAAMPRMQVGVVVTDYWMPEMNGFDFIRTAAPLLPGVPFIIISGHAMHLEEDNLQRLEPLRTILPKPFSYRKLAEEILTYAPELRPGPTTASAPAG
jgi:DNA-binding NtrC family response regulator